jgi:Uma2 family endonuclease
MLGKGDATMPATLYSLDWYLKHSGEFEPDADYVDGEIELRPMGVLDHATWQQAIEMWFIQQRSAWNIRVRCEYRIQVSPTRCRIPDVVVWDRSRPPEQVLSYPPIAVFEVLSPEDRMSRMMIKLADYEAMGIRTIRVIEPEAGTISRLEHGKLEPIASRIEQLPGSLCSIDWTKVEGLLDL